jgi:hypothetical protein
MAAIVESFDTPISIGSALFESKLRQSSSERKDAAIAEFGQIMAREKFDVREPDPQSAIDGYSFRIVVDPFGLPGQMQMARLKDVAIETARAHGLAAYSYSKWHPGGVLVIRVGFGEMFPSAA